MKQLCATAATLATVAGLLIGCRSSPADPGPSQTPSANTFTINIIREAGNQSFVPNPASPGLQMVVFRNTDAVTHRVLLNGTAIDTGDLAPGQSSAPVQIPAAGAHYHCPLHPTMIGQVNASDGATAPPCEGIYCD